jgi:hypothetical protein
VFVLLAIVILGLAAAIVGMVQGGGAAAAAVGIAAIGLLAIGWTTHLQRTK